MKCCKSRKIFLSLLFILIVIVFLYNFYKYEIIFNHSLKYGDKVKSQAFKNNEGKEYTIKKGQWNLIVIIDNLRKKYSFIKYIDYLANKKFIYSNVNIKKKRLRKEILLKIIILLNPSYLLKKIQSF